VKLVSILGDSISTYMGFNPNGYAVFYDEYNSKKNSITSEHDLWWWKVNEFLNAEICVNNSFSGSKVSGDEFPSASSDERTSHLGTVKKKPDLILIYIGFNDFGNGINVKPGYNSSNSFFESYCNMLMKIKNNYPKSKIFCGTLMKGFVRDKDSWIFPDKFAGISIYEYNSSIRIAARMMNVEVVDLASLEVDYETLDGTHPTKDGHNTIAQAWISCLEKSMYCKI